MYLTIIISCNCNILTCIDNADKRIEQHLKKSISILEALKDEARWDDLELYYYKLGTALINQGEE